jgi:hypothetical protein
LKASWGVIPAKEFKWMGPLIVLFQIIRKVLGWEVFNLGSCFFLSFEDPEYFLEGSLTFPTGQTVLCEEWVMQF